MDVFDREWVSLAFYLQLCLYQHIEHSVFESLNSLILVTQNKEALRATFDLDVDCRCWTLVPDRARHFTFFIKL